MAGYDHQFKEAAERETRLEEELVAPHNSRNDRKTTIRVLEARTIEKDGALFQELARIAKVEV